MMTLSILARCPQTGHLGGIVASHPMCSAAFVLRGIGGVGLVASQAFVNPRLQPFILSKLSSGTALEEIFEALQDFDPRLDLRQFAFILDSGLVAMHSGYNVTECVSLEMDDGFIAFGNTLKNSEVAKGALIGWLDTKNEKLEDRLLHCLQLAENAGGDSRGFRSAGLTIFGPESYPLAELRIDRSFSPINDLKENWIQFRESMSEFVSLLPNKSSPGGLRGIERPTTYEGQNIVRIGL